MFVGKKLSILKKYELSVPHGNYFPSKINSANQDNCVDRPQKSKKL